MEGIGARLATIIVAAAVPSVAGAVPIPAPVAAMIDAAAADPAALKTVADLARKTNPASLAEIDARVADIAAGAAAARTARLESQSLWQGWSGEGQIGAATSSGNTDSTGVAVGIKVAREGLRWKHEVNAVVDYQKDNGVTSKRRYLAGYGVNYKFSPRLYALGVLGYEQDRFAGFDSRFSEGVGLGYKVIDRPRLTLAVEAGPALRQTKFISGSSDSSVTGRFAGDLAWKLGPTTMLTEAVSYFVGGDSSTLTSETALTAKLYGALAMPAVLLPAEREQSAPIPQGYRHHQPCLIGLRLLT